MKTLKYITFIALAVITAEFIATTIKHNNIVPKAQIEEVSVEVSIDGTPQWRKVKVTDVIHVIIDENTLTDVKNYSL
jgi:hypothetical protein